MVGEIEVGGMITNPNPLIPFWRWDNPWAITLVVGIFALIVIIWFYYMVNYKINKKGR